MKQKNGVNAKKIAELAGVSPSTVSMVLNNKGDEFRIAAKTCEKIIKAANELGYQHVPRERRKKKNFNQTLICAFCPPNFDKGPMAEVFTVVDKYLNDQRLPYEFILFPYTQGNLQEKAAWLSSEFIAGAIILGMTDNDVEFIENNAIDIPAVLFNRTAKGYCSVLTDDYAVGKKAMSHFIKRGHRRFGLISPNHSNQALSLRAVGYGNKFQNENFKPGEAFMSPVAFGSDDDTGGYFAMQNVFQSEILPSALLLTSDNMLSGVMRCIHENGLAVPKDIEIISYGNKEVNFILEPNISSFVPPTYEMSYNSIRMIHRFLGEGAREENIKLSFEAECIFRESCPAI
jgi:DNA-binding LacI/PurR family transcriptional regulator